MKPRYPLAFFIICQILACQIGFAAGSTKLHTLDIQTPSADLKIFLPGDLVQGEPVLFSIAVMPKGNSEKRRERNLQKLTQYRVLIQQSEYPVRPGRYVFHIDDDVQGLDVLLRDPKDRVVWNESLTVHTEPPVMPVFVPAMLRKGYREMISHPLQTPLSDVQVQIDGRGAQVLAASMRSIHLETPDMKPGSKSMDITGTDTALHRKVNIADFTMSAGNTSLMRGETTRIKLSVEGLEGIEDPVTISLNNVSASTIELEGGNRQSITIEPGHSSWIRTLEVRSLKDGEFVVRGDLEQPVPGEVVDGHYTDCDLKGDAYILPPDVCRQIRQGISQAEPGPSRPVHIPEWNYSSIDTRIYPHDTLQIRISVDDPSVVFVAVAIEDALARIVDTTYVDTIAHDGWAVEIMPGMPNALYTGSVAVYYGPNRVSEQGIYWYVGEDILDMSITNGRIERLRGDEEDLIGEIDDLRRRIRQREERAREEDVNASEDDTEAWKDESMVRELAEIDEVLEGVEDAYSDRLRAVLDSLMAFNKAVPQLPDTAALRDRYEALKEAAEICKDQLKELEDEHEELQGAIPDIESRQKATYKDIIALYRETGYNFMGRSSRDEQGNFNYRYGVILGEKYYRGSVPAEIASEVTDLEKELQGLAEKHQQSRERLAELPSKIASKSEECDELEDDLRQAREALEEGMAHAKTNAALHLEREEYCRQIRALLKPLKEWCAARDDMQGMLRAIEQFMERCPSDTVALRYFWSEYNQIVQRKKNAEEDHVNRARRHREDADNHRDNADAERDDAAELRDALAGLYGKLDETRRARAAAVAAEKERRKQVARQRRKACENLLKGQGVDPQTELQKLKDLERIKDDMQEISGMINDALNTAEGMSDGKAGEIAGKLSEELEKLMEPLEKYDEIKSEVEDMLEWKDRLEVLLDPDDSPRARAEKFGAWLEGVEDVLSEVSEKFPILQFFTSYFSFLVEGYNAALSGTEAILRNRYGEIVEGGIDRVSCESLIDEYTKEGSEEAVCQLVFDKLDMNYYDYRGEWNRELIDEAVCDKAMTKLIDCCLTELSR